VPVFLASPRAARCISARSPDREERTPCTGRSWKTTRIAPLRSWIFCLLRANTSPAISTFLQTKATSFSIPICPQSWAGRSIRCFPETRRHMDAAPESGQAVNTSGYDFAPSISPDGKYLFFTRDVGGGQGDIYWISTKLSIAFGETRRAPVLSTSSIRNLLQAPMIRFAHLKHHQNNWTKLSIFDTVFSCSRGLSHWPQSPRNEKELPMTDHSQMKLGRKAIKTDTRTLAFGDYLTPSLPPPPAAATGPRASPVGA